MDDTYEGWANWETWNVALWVQNDEVLYSVARECREWSQLRDWLEDCGMFETPDHVRFDNWRLDCDALDAMIRELRDE